MSAFYSIIFYNIHILSIYRNNLRFIITAQHRSVGYHDVCLDSQIMALFDFFKSDYSSLSYKAI